MVAQRTLDPYILVRIRRPSLIAQKVGFVSDDDPNLALDEPDLSGRVAFIAIIDAASFVFCFF